MDFLKLPPELMETIFLKLDPQALAACALAEKCLAKVIYSSHLLDAYCRKTLSCPWITARDIEKLDITVPFQFWFLVYTTLKLEETKGKLLLHNSLLTKIGTFNDMFIMWLVCGHRSSYLDSYALMNELYPVPATVADAFSTDSRPEPFVIDTLLKVFFCFPEIMQISCGNVRLFQMQEGSSKKLFLENIYDNNIEKTLVKPFTLIHSVEIVSASCSSGHASVMVLIGKEYWVLWLGTISTASEEASLVNKSFQQSFSHNLPPSRIKELAHVSVCVLEDQIRKDNSTLSRSPIISGVNSDIASLIISQAQENNRSLHKKFLSVYESHCQNVVDSLKDLDDNEKRVVLKQFHHRAHPRNQIDDYILKILQTDVSSVKMYSGYQLPFAIYKSVLERIGCLYRNETNYFIENTFCHSFLCGCIGPALPVKSTCNVDTRIEKCISSNMNDGIFSPLMWPPHVLSTACQLVPVLTFVLKADIHLIRNGRQKDAVPSNMLDHLSEQLYQHGLMFTNRPPSKPRCPLLMKQVRLLNPDVIQK